jgi:hypothetical protein
VSFFNKRLVEVNKFFEKLTSQTLSSTNLQKSLKLHRLPYFPISLTKKLKQNTKKTTKTPNLINSKRG